MHLGWVHADSMAQADNALACPLRQHIVDVRLDEMEDLSPVPPRERKGLQGVKFTGR